MKIVTILLIVKAWQNEYDKQGEYGDSQYGGNGNNGEYDNYEYA